MSCYAKRPDVAGIECWHGPGHMGDHGKESRTWPNEADPVQVELRALRKVADAALAQLSSRPWGLGKTDNDLRAALKESGRWQP